MSVNIKTIKGMSRCTKYELLNMDNTLDNIYEKFQELQQELKQLENVDKNH